MCGITGIVSFSASGRQWMDHLGAATNALQRRGPDAGKVFMEDNVGFGHRRLSIIDVSEQANQPMFDHSQRFVIVFNGEIFNYRELKAELLSKGAVFNNHSDTEVLLELYKREHTGFLNKLNGFYAFAIYDREEKSVFLARDRYGLKPLHIYQDEDRFLFASEMKALMQFPVPRQLDKTSLYQYLQLNYIPAPHSIFKSVKKLMPGHFMMVKNGQAETTCFYKLRDRSEEEQAPLSYEKAQQQLVNLLEDSVQRRLIADVPVGAFLSGGIDSSVVVALASRFTSQLNTFSIGYKDHPFFDETMYANLVAKKYKTHHTVFSLTNEQLFEDLHSMLDYIDEPFADSSALPLHILCKHTRRSATVALSGDGADEVFGGYMKHLGEYRVRNAGLAAKAISLLLPLWNSLPKSRNSRVSDRIRQVKKFSQGMRMSAPDRYYRWCGVADEKETNRLLDDHLHPDQAEYLQRKAVNTQYIRGGKSINDMLLNDMDLVLLNDMLPKVDMMSMANSLEVRVPFLDYRVVDFAFRLPSEYKINGQERKRILQDAFRDLLPPELYHRPKKGFEVPLLQWFRSDLYSMINEELLEDSFIADQGIFDPEEIRSLKRKLFSNNPEDVHARIWALIVFQHWYREYDIVA